MRRDEPVPVVTLDAEKSIWNHFFTVAPLVVIGTREGDGYDLAPKHMVTPLGRGNYFGFTCTPRHATYHNARHAGAFTVTFPRPSQVLLTSLAAGPRCGPSGDKPLLNVLPTRPAEVVDGVFLEDGYLFLECELEKVVDGLGENSFLIGRIVAAHVREDALRVGATTDDERLDAAPLLAFIAPSHYTTIREGRAFPLPHGFRP